MTSKDEVKAILLNMQWCHAVTTKSLDEATTKISKMIEEAEERVAEHFSDGVPFGFTVQNWLAVARMTFDSEGKPTIHPNTLKETKDNERS